MIDEFIQKPKKIKKEKEKQKVYFYPLISNWIRPQFKNFWKKEPKEQVPVQWTIGNYIDYFWPNWKKYFLISNQTLQRKMLKTNIVWYENKETIKVPKLRQEVTLSNLATLGVTAKNFKTKQETLNQLVKLIRNKTNSWATIKGFIEQNFYEKTAKKLQKILQANLLSFQWTDFYPELL